MNKTLKLLFITFIFIFFALITTDITFAAADCKSYIGWRGQHASSSITGRSCGFAGANNPLGKGQYSTQKECLGSAGGSYLVTYCTGDSDWLTPPTGTQSEQVGGCEETYPERDLANAPPPCSRPDQPAPGAIGQIFGRIRPPAFIQSFGFGGLGISKFLSNLVTLIYSLAAVVFVFMMLWGAFEWLTSGGDKEKIEAARNRLINAIIGMILFAIAFTIIQIFGIFTGWTFFKGQQQSYYCYKGATLDLSKSPPVCVDNSSAAEYRAITCAENQLFTASGCKNPE